MNPFSSILQESQLEESQSEAGTPARRNPIGCRRISSDGTLESVGGGGNTSSSLVLFTKRAYSDVYSRNKRLQEFASRRSLSDSGNQLIGLTDDARTEAPSGDILLKENLEQQGTSSNSDTKDNTIHKSTEEKTLKKSSADEQKIENSGDTTGRGERIVGEIDEGDKCGNLDNVTAIALDKELKPVSENKDSKLTPPTSVPVISISDTEIREKTNSAAVEKFSAESSESDAQSVIPCDTVESKVVHVDEPTVQVNEESQGESEPKLVTKVRAKDELLNRDSIDNEVEEPVVVRRQNKPSPESEQHRSSLPPNFFSEHTSPVPPPRRNSPRKKVEKTRTGSLHTGPGRSGLLHGLAPNKLKGDKFEVRSDLTRPLYISTSPKVPVKGLHPSPLQPQSSNSSSPEKLSPKRRAPTAPSPVASSTPSDSVRQKETSSISRSRPHSIACPEESQSILKGQLSSANSSPVAPPRSKRKLARKPRGSSAPSDIPSQGANAAEQTTEDEIIPESHQNEEDISLEDLSEMEARQRRLELEQMRDNLFGYKQKQSLSSDANGDGTSSIQSNAVVVKLGDENDVGTKSTSPSGKHQVLIDVAKSDFSPQRASTTINVTNNQHSFTSPEFKSRIKLSFSDEGEDFDSSYSKPVDVNKSAKERLDSLIKEDTKSYKTVVDLNGRTSPNVRSQKGTSPTANGGQKSRIILDLDDHQYRPQTRDVSAISSVSADEEYMLQGRPALDNAKHVYKTDIFVSGHHDTSSSTYESASNNEESESSANIDVSSLAKSETELSGDSDISDDEGTFQATFEPGSQQASVIDTRTMIKLDDDGDSGITLVSYHNRLHSDSFEDEKVPSPRRSTGVTLNLTPVNTSMSKVHSPPDIEPEMSSAPRLIKMTRSDGQQVEPVVTPKLQMEARSTVIPLQDLEEPHSPVLEPVISPSRSMPKLESVSPNVTPARPDPMSFFEPELSGPHITAKPREISRPAQTLLNSPGASRPSLPLHREIQSGGAVTSSLEQDADVSSPDRSPGMGMRPDMMSFFDPDITKAVTSPRARELKRPAPPAPVDLDPPPRRMISPPGVRELKRPAPSPPASDTTLPLNPSVAWSPDKHMSPLAARSTPPYDSGLSTVAQTGTTVFYSDRLKSVNTSEGSSPTNDNQQHSGVPGDGANLASDQRAVYDPAGGARLSSTGHWETEGGDPRKRATPSTLRISGDTRAQLQAHVLSPSSRTTGGASFYSPSSGHNNSNTSTSSTPDLLPPSSTNSASSSGVGVGGGGAGGRGGEVGTAQQESMDPITGLRKTGPISAVDKAVKFVATTEPSFRVKIKDAVAEQVEGERATLIDSMRVRRKKLDSWVPGDEVLSPTESPKTMSEIMYEQRKNSSKIQDSSPKYQRNDTNKTAPPDVIPTHIPLTQGEFIFIYCFCMPPVKPLVYLAEIPKLLKYHYRFFLSVRCFSVKSNR